MKRILLFSTLVLMMGASIAASHTAKIEGHWLYAEGGHSVEVTYRADHTFLGNVALQGKVVWEYEGTWSINGDTLNYRYTQSSLSRIPAGTTGADQLIQVAKDHFMLQTKDGNRHEYRRVK